MTMTIYLIQQNCCSWNYCHTKILWLEYSDKYEQWSVASDFYTNDGRNVTDGTSFILNRNTMKYTRYVIDSAEY